MLQPLNGYGFGEWMTRKARKRKGSQLHAPQTLIILVPEVGIEPT